MLAGRVIVVHWAARMVVIHPAFAPMLEALAPFAEAVVPMFTEAIAHAVTDHHLQAVFLGIVELIVERLRGIGEAFEIGPGLAHEISAAAKPLHGIELAFVLFALGLALLDALDALFGEILQHAFYRRPKFFLIGRERETRVQGCDTRVGESGAVGGGGAQCGSSPRGGCWAMAV